MSTIPRPEHPNPQFERKNWRNLNGTWEFEIDKSNWGDQRGFVEQEHFSQTVTVPFCPESPLSGVGIIDFMDAVWYKRHISISEEELSGDVILHFGAVDYDCTVYVNGKRVGNHKGGFSSFEMVITPYLTVGENILTVRAIDMTRSEYQPSGKQSNLAASYSCLYTRTTGIWQTVWLEFVPKARLNYFKLTPNEKACSVMIEAFPTQAGTLLAECFYEGKLMGSRKVEIGSISGSFELPLAEKHLWEVGNGRLYDLKLTFEEDEVNTYFGLRSIEFDGMKFLLNSRPVFQRLILDQGFYPDGIYTAPDEETLKKDIELSQAMGFNGARLHQKVFEPRFLYHCDKAGYLVWGEYPSWGFDISSKEMVQIFSQEWVEVVRRDYNHPSIIGWCPLNETQVPEHREQYDLNLACVYAITKAMDLTRPCIDTSGYHHVITDVYCLHDYNQDPVTFKADHDKLMNEGVLADKFTYRQTYRGEPVFVSEYGGIAWMPLASNSWGYGQMPTSEEEYIQRFDGLTTALLDNDQMFGFCYTQLYDIELETNGLYTYERVPKFPAEVISAIVSKPAAIEK